MLTTARMVMERARELAKMHVPVVAVAGAEDDDVLLAVANAQKAGMVQAHLVGGAAKIEKLLGELSLSASDFRITDAADAKSAIEKAVELCSRGECSVLMKGKVPTPDLMKAVLAPDAGLRIGKVLSHCAVLELPGYPKLLSFTDGGVLATPDFEQKICIVENAVRVSRLIGVDQPKVALLGVLDEADPDFPSTVEAAAVARACVERGIARFVEGPMTLRTALTKSARPSAVAGEPDILVSHAIEEINITVKALNLFRGTTFMGVITGAKVPLSLVSRSDPPENKMASLALAAVMAGEAK
ncbi:MAG: phosphate acyltransferase [bacterium]|nr:phosphate acyltransferase [bacterium]